MVAASIRRAVCQALSAQIDRPLARRVRQSSRYAQVRHEGCFPARISTRRSDMPRNETLRRVMRDKREGKSRSTQAGEFVREEMNDIREGKHGARSAKQAIAIGLSKARRAGVPLAPPKRGTTSEQTRRKAARDLARSHTRQKRPAARRSSATLSALEREPRASASHAALSEQARSAAGRRTPSQRSKSAQKAARTKGPGGRSAAARRAARSRKSHASAEQPGVR
jgi:hypothetical protein